MAKLVKRPRSGIMLDIERARDLLARSTDLGEIKRLRDQADAMSRYLRAQKAGDHAAAKASVIAREAECRAGELLAKMDLQQAGPGRGKRGKKVSQIPDTFPDRRERNRLREAASVPVKVRRQVLDAAVKSGKPVAASALPKIARERRRQALADRLRKKPIRAAAGRYGVIVIDPPWRYARDDDSTHKVSTPYPTMSTDEIKAVPVAARAERDCVLWLWTTNTHLRDAFACIDAWGFEYKTMLTWAKNQMGAGSWLRGKTEHCLLAVRGKPLLTLTNQTTLLVAKRTTHSRKPSEFYDLVEALCPGSKLEMFARRRRKGWASWGAELA